MTAELIIPASELGWPALEVLTAEQATQFAADVQQAGLIRITDQASMDQANALVMRLHAADKTMEERSDFLKKPIQSLLNSIRSVIATNQQPVQRAKQALKTGIGSFMRHQEAERARLHQIELDRHAAEVRRLQDLADAKRKAEEQEARRVAAELAELLGEEQVSAKPLPVSPAAPLPAAPRAPEAVRSAVQVSYRTELEEVDARLTPYQISMPGEQGEVLTLCEVKRGAIRKALDAGIKVPGWRFKQVEHTSMSHRKPDEFFG
jgi:hypothetical protein